MSEELFNIFIDAINNSNMLVKDYPIKLTTPRLKSGTESESTDCVAYTIRAALSACGVTKSLSEIKAWLENTYGTEGVPGNSISAALNHYVNAHQISLPSTYNSSSSLKIIIIERISASQGHSCILLVVSNGAVMYQDNQNSGVNRFCFSTDIVYSFSVSKK
ncbi:MAG: hypothetical protein LBI60_00445 [Bacteroidales bacterium]|jgi:hypothetical protein|nr:hypothetical protein [Bacteroidales bacterium]